MREEQETLLVWTARSSSSLFLLSTDRLRIFIIGIPFRILLLLLTGNCPVELSINSNKTAFWTHVEVQVDLLSSGYLQHVSHPHLQRTCFPTLVLLNEPFMKTSGIGAGKKLRIEWSSCRMSTVKRFLF